jgi:hypothetical protein
MLYRWRLAAWAMYIAGMFIVRLRMMEQCRELIGVGMSVATVGILLVVGENVGRALLVDYYFNSMLLLHILKVNTTYVSTPKRSIVCFA